MVGLATMAVQSKVRITDILTLIRNGTLREVALVSGLTLFKAVRVNRTEVLRTLTGAAEPVVADQLAQQLKINGGAIPGLVATGLLRTAVPPFPEMKCGLTNVVDQSEVDRFQCEYADFRTACQMTGAASVKGIAKLGVKPAISIKLRVEGQGRAIFYRRSELLELSKP